MIGAGAVGGSLAYWLREFSVSGQWVVVDRDRPDVTNLNRTILFSASDAGWPNQEPGWKATLAANAISNATPVHKWYNEYSLTSTEEFDVVLCMANEFNVREELACRNFSVLLHATTGTNWLSQLHRHIPGRDDCIFCRVGDIKTPKFSCSTAAVGPPAENGSGDAALPFLSATSGLMLATLLQKLSAGELMSDECNDWRWDFASNYKMAAYARRACSGLCTRVSSLDVRKRLHVNGRWKSLER
jgi:molybdopterin/thiamine biosynthesis adenylyltransferase